MVDKAREEQVVSHHVLVNPKDTGLLSLLIMVIAMMTNLRSFTKKQKQKKN